MKEGDSVIIRATISSISPGPDYCNLSLQTEEPMYPGTHKTGISLNAKQVELAVPPAPPPEEATTPADLPTAA